MFHRRSYVLAARILSRRSQRHHADRGSRDLKDTRRKHRAARIQRFNHDPRFHLRRDADKSGRTPGQGFELVRQRVGLFEPHAGHGGGADERPITGPGIAYFFGEPRRGTPFG